MYISIDRGKARFLHKHESVNVVCNLDFITTHLRPEHRYPEAFVEVCPISHPWVFRDWTETEKQLLFKNTTGQERSPYLGTQLIGVLIELADRFPVTDVNPFEAEVQAAYIETHHPNGLGPKYRYVKGATVPAAGGDLFEHLVQLSPEDAAVAARTRAPRAPTPAPVSAAPIAATAHSVPRSAPRRPGGVREIIWKVADEMWEKAGRPTDKSQVLTLRKEMMDVLDKEHLVKRSSSSNELGNWQKARL